MKKNSILWAALSMTAALVMTACSSDDNNMTEAPVAPSTSKTIPYTVTVGGDEATTRATVDGNNKTLYFATGDQLYITGPGIQGVLDLVDDVENENKASDVTFSGELTYSGSGSPADDLSLTATLVSAQQTEGTHFSVDAAGAVTVNYPTTAYCSSINDAVQKYSNLTGTCKYSQKAFTLTQQTAFLNFVITFEDGTATNTTLSAVVSNGGAAVCTANVTTVTDNGVKAKFVLPVAKGTTLSSANVKFGDKAAISFGSSQKLEGKVYNVTKTQAAAAYTMAANATAGDVGKLICTDGHIHTYSADAACTKSRVAKIIYVGSSTGDATYNHGLALALTDESSSGMDWNNAKTACTNKNTSATVESASWMLPSRTQWETMGATSSTYTTLRNGFTSVGGSDLESYYYWSSTEVEDDPGSAWMFGFGNDHWYHDGKGNAWPLVRACLAF